MPANDDPAMAERGRVEQRLARAGGVRRDAADDDAKALVRECRDALEQVEIGADEALVIQQVSGWIAGRGELA